MDTLVRSEFALGPIHLVVVLDRVGSQVFEHPMGDTGPLVVREDVVVERADVGESRETVLHDLGDPGRGGGKVCGVVCQCWYGRRDSSKDRETRFLGGQEVLK